MRYINLLSYFNRIIFVLTIILYATIFFGLLAQILLGAFQVLVAVILLFFYKKIEIRLYKYLILYFCSVLAYEFLWIIAPVNSYMDFTWVLFYILIPISIACYFTFILETLKLKNDVK